MILEKKPALFLRIRIHKIPVSGRFNLNWITFWQNFEKGYCQIYRQNLKGKWEGGVKVEQIFRQGGWCVTRKCRCNQGEQKLNCCTRFLQKAQLCRGELEETRSIEDDFVVLLQYFLMGNSNFVASKEDAYMSLQPAHSCKAEMRVEKGLVFEATFGKLLSISASPCWSKKQR